MCATARSTSSRTTRTARPCEWGCVCVENARGMRARLADACPVFSQKMLHIVRGFTHVSRGPVQKAYAAAGRLCLSARKEIREGHRYIGSLAYMCTHAAWRAQVERGMGSEAGRQASEKEKKRLFAARISSGPLASRPAGCSPHVAPGTAACDGACGRCRPGAARSGASARRT